MSNMASTAATKKKQKKKGQTLSLNAFLADEQGSAGPGTSYVLANKSVDWATEMENQDVDDTDFDFGMGPKVAVNRSLLPTAPRAARGPDVDPAKVPSAPPYTAFLGNLPYDVSEEDIVGFFRNLQVNNVRLPDDGSRSRGFGYAEFVDRQGLIDALGMNDETLHGRKIRVDLAGQQSGGERDRNGRGGRDDGRPDRTESDWRRRDDPPEYKQDERYNDRYDGGRESGRYGAPNDRYGAPNDRYGGSSDRYGAPSDRYGAPNDRYGGSNDRYGDRRRDDGYNRGYGGFGGDRGYGGDRDRGGDRYRDRGGYGSDRGYGGDRGYDRGYGGDRGGDDRGYGRRSNFGSGYRPDEGEGRYGRGRYGEDRPMRDNRSMDRPPSRESSRDPPKERPKLQLAPRTKPVEAAKPQTTSSIFGGAKPVDTAARERQIEERLQREKEDQMRRHVEEEKENREGDYRKDWSQGSSRTRRDSGRSSDGGTGRERRLSSSGSGKGIRPVPPPLTTTSNRPRRDSEISNNSEVFDEERTPHKASEVVSPDTRTSPHRDDTKVVPAPPPKENIWEKRKVEKSPTSVSSSETTPPPPKQAEVRRTPPAGKVVRKAEVSIASPPPENPWRKRHSEHEDDGERRSGPWGRPAGRGEGTESRGRGSYSARGRGVGADKKPQRERQPPKSIEEMPKYEENVKKDWSDKNKFSFLGEDEVGDDEED